MQDRGLTEEEAVEHAEDYVPTIDDAEDAPPPATYRDWRKEDTRVVVFTTAPERFTRDRAAVNRGDAEAQCKLTFGPILEANCLVDGQGDSRFFFRVRRIA